MIKTVRSELSASERRARRQRRERLASGIGMLLSLGFVYLGGFLSSDLLSYSALASFIFWSVMLVRALRSEYERA